MSSSPTSHARVWYCMNELCLKIPGTSSCICYPLPTATHMFRMANQHFYFFFTSALSPGVEFQFQFGFSPSLNGFLFVTVVCSSVPVVGQGVRSLTDLWPESFSSPVNPLFSTTKTQKKNFSQEGNNRVASLLRHVNWGRGSSPWRYKRFIYVVSHHTNLYFRTTHSVAPWPDSFSGGPSDFMNSWMLHVPLKVIYFL